MSVRYIDVPGDTWTWGEEYAMAVAEYLVACPADRRVQVGMGVMAFGEPRGEKIRFSGEQAITVVGLGALHFRVDDGKGPCRVGIVQRSAKPFGYTWRF